MHYKRGKKWRDGWWMMMMMIPRGQCHRSCNGHSRAGRRERGVVGPVKRKWMRRTCLILLLFLFLLIPFFFSSFLSFLFFLMIWFDWWDWLISSRGFGDGQIKLPMDLILLIVELLLRERREQTKHRKKGKRETGWRDMPLKY